mmetsp:Transcript_53868/g.100919  ORF Transcript_53868/g.100919 Transcript_53868/m.100919 type:complete len:347 (+) Transcript_53868:66-1106(+)
MVGRDQLYVGVLAVLYILASAGSTFFNKWLMDERRYPYSSALAMGHMFFMTVCLTGTLGAQPTMFPALVQFFQQSRSTVWPALKWLSLTGLILTAQLILSNMAFLETSLVLVQMMKEGSVVLVYLLSLALGLEYFTVTKGVALLLVIIATSMTMRGAVNFSEQGCLLQLSSQVMESFRIVLQAMVLSYHRFDPLSYNLILAPFCLMGLSAVQFVAVRTSTGGLLQVPSAETIWLWLPVLAVNAALFMALNIIMAAFIQRTSPLTIVLSGIIKDASIVLSGRYFMGDELTPMQEIGFLLQLGLIFAWYQIQAFDSEEKLKQSAEVERIGPEKPKYGATSLPAAQEDA